MTGRTHQIRVHFSNARHPLAGDKTYGYKAKNSGFVIPRVMPHAWKLWFEHPLTKKRMKFEALPNDFQFLLKDGRVNIQDKLYLLICLEERALVI